MNSTGRSKEEEIAGVDPAYMDGGFVSKVKNTLLRPNLQIKDVGSIE